MIRSREQLKAIFAALQGSPLRRARTLIKKGALEWESGKYSGKRRYRGDLMYTAAADKLSNYGRGMPSLTKSLGLMAARGKGSHRGGARFFTEKSFKKLGLQKPYRYHYGKDYR